MRQALEMKPY